MVKAKRQSKNVAGDITQSKRYSRDFQLRGDAAFLGEPWGEYRVPFVFATNGREFLEQLRTMSGIWFCDLRRAENISRPLKNWYSPADLIDTLAQDLDRSQQQLEGESFEYNFTLRPYQKKAIQAVEAALAEDRRTILLAMATETGKTKTSITLVYRLLKTKRFRRILFIVDRSALGEQTEGAFKETRMENLQTFADIFDVKELKDTEPDRDTKVHIATIQGMLKRLLYPVDDAPTLTAGQYDCIIVDECHRGYLLDREMSDTELTFRDLNDYISKYRRVLDFFDAVKIGLTATPALHTSQISGNPVYVYSYREAALGDALIPYSDRVDRSMKQILASQAWTPPQRKWLERIGKQIKMKYVVDRTALDEGAFR
jgi:type I restriction enzyme, R subunit